MWWFFHVAGLWIKLRSAGEAGVDREFEGQGCAQEFTLSTIAGRTEGIPRALATIF